MKLDANGRLSLTQLKLVETYLRASAVVYAKYMRYYAGDNPTIIDADEKAEPDNRVPCGFGGKIVDTLKGYMAKPGYITGKSDGEYYEQLKKDVLDKNDEELLTAELFTDACACGRSYEIFRINEDAKQIRQYRCIPGTGYAVFDDTLDRNMIAFLHMVSYLNDQNTMEYVKTVYYADAFIEYTGAVDTWDNGIEKAHPFGIVPVAEYQPNILRLPVFNIVLALIDEHDKIISSGYANEMERFANAYIRILKEIDTVTKDENGQTPADKIKSIRMFTGLGSDGDVKSVADAVDFMVKPSRGEDLKESADRFERLIYDLAMVINPNDFEAGTAIAAIAFKMKLLPMEFKAADIEAYFSRGLQQRYKILANATEIHRLTPEPITIQWRRNIPIDIEALATEAGLLNGILTKKTILNLFPADIVPDKDKELEDLDGEAEKRLPAVAEPMNNDDERMDQSMDSSDADV